MMLAAFCALEDFVSRPVEDSLPHLMHTQILLLISVKMDNNEKGRIASLSLIYFIMKKKRFSLIEVIVLIATIILFSLIFTKWDMIKNWFF